VIESDSDEPVAPFSLCRWLCKIALHELFDFTVCGEENVPAAGPCIIAANHCSFLDPPAAVVGCGRNTFSIARRTLSSGGIWHWLFSRMHTIAIDRDGGNDLSAIRSSLKLLERGHSILLFPEGSRSHDGTIQRGKRGVALLVSMAKVPLIPAKIFGTFEAWNCSSKFPKLFSPVHISFGAPIMAEEYLPHSSGSDRNGLIVDFIMNRIGAIAPW
jgi:1-acyl-sn-glycerol-3-phosphate acyltransferase